MTLGITPFVSDEGQSAANALQFDDVIRHVAISLKIHERLIKKVPIDQAVTLNFADFHDDNLTVYRFAAETIVSQFLKSEQRRAQSEVKAEDPLYLLIREEIRERTDGIHTVINNINEMLNLRSQILTAAISGIAISVFIIIATVLPASLDEAVKAWKHMVSPP